MRHLNDGPTRHLAYRVLQIFTGQCSICNLQLRYTIQGCKWTYPRVIQFVTFLSPGWRSLSHPKKVTSRIDRSLLFFFSKPPDHPGTTLSPVNQRSNAFTCSEKRCSEKRRPPIFGAILEDGFRFPLGLTHPAGCGITGGLHFPNPHFRCPVARWWQLKCFLLDFSPTNFPREKGSNLTSPSLLENG